MLLAEVQRIVTSYGAVLEERVATGVVRDISSLPCPKLQIKEALQCAMRVTTDAPGREQLKIAFISLADFQELSDEEIVALRNWNKALKTSSQDMTVANLRKQPDAMSKIGESVDAIQARSMAEMEALLSELKQAGF